MTSRTLIIAEAGVNHNGDLALAKQLIDVAAVAGADLVKFQTFTADRLATRAAQKGRLPESNDNQHGIPARDAEPLRADGCNAP